MALADNVDDHPAALALLGSAGLSQRTAPAISMPAIFVERQALTLARTGAVDRG